MQQLRLYRGPREAIARSRYMCLVLKDEQEFTSPRDDRTSIGTRTNVLYIYLESDVRKGEGEYEGVVRPGRGDGVQRWGPHQVPGGGGKDYITVSGV